MNGFGKLDRSDNGRPGGVQIERLLAVAGVLVCGYLAIAFGKPYYQYAMMYQAFDDAVDAGMARIQVARSYAGSDLTGEVMQAVETFLQNRARGLDVPLEPRDIQVRTLAGRLMVRLAWMAPVKLLDRAIPLSFSLEKERKLPE